jgi:hypothetical protein
MTRKAEISENMVQGRMTDFESYQKHVGIGQGLEESCAIIDETLKQLDKEMD